MARPAAEMVAIMARPVSCASRAAALIRGDG